MEKECLRVFVESPDGVAEHVLRTLRESGAEVRHVSLAAPSLEDVYIQLTGRELRE